MSLPVEQARTGWRIEVPADHPAFVGHFPGSPVWPGALLLDVVARHLPNEAAGPREFARVKFRRPVRPGTNLLLQGAPGRDGGWSFTLRDAGGHVVADGIVREGAAA